MLNGAEATARGRATGRTWKGGVFSPSDGTADPSRAVPVVARAILNLGGTVHQRCAARGLELSGGRVSAVVTEKGAIRTTIAVLAGGAWASSFCRQLNLRCPQATVRSSILAGSAGANDLPDALHTADASVRGLHARHQRPRVSPTPDKSQLRLSHERALDLLPACAAPPSPIVGQVISIRRPTASRRSARSPPSPASFWPQASAGTASALGRGRAIS